MDNENAFNGASELRGDYRRLSQWLQLVLNTSGDEHDEAPVTEHDVQPQPTMGSDYHIAYYQLIPDFCMALLRKEPDATVSYAHLLFHLASCRSCHRTYLDMYDALREAVYPQSPRPLLGQGTRTLSATPHRMLCHLSQTLISQAEAILLQARHEHEDHDEAARSLLQLAIRVSAHIVQSSLRRQALQDLVRVATLFEGPTAPATEAPLTNTHTYVPVLATSGARRGPVDQALRGSAAQKATITLQSDHLDGLLVQQGETLELRLRNLPVELHGMHVRISVPLGRLSEQIRWLGDNPQAIRSTAAVTASGELTTLLGTTNLDLNIPEERNLIEAVLLQVTIQPEH